MSGGHPTTENDTVVVTGFNQTMAEHSKPLIARAYETGDMPKLLPNF